MYFYVHSYLKSYQKIVSKLRGMEPYTLDCIFGCISSKVEVWIKTYILLLIQFHISCKGGTGFVQNNNKKKVHHEIEMGLSGLKVYLNFEVV